MADIRALTTVFGFRVDESGLKQYETVITRIKGLAMEAGKMFGLYFAIDKIGEYIGEVVKAGREMNRLNMQISLLARGSDNAQEAQASLFDIAQKLGVEYKDIAETYRGFLIDSQDSKISQEELLTATENVYKSLRVGRVSAEEMARAVQAIERGLRLGRIGPRQIGMLVTTPGLAEAISQGAGMSITALRQLARTGKITGEQLIEWLAKPNEQLQKQFEAMPQRIDWVFARIGNTLAYATAQIWKLSEGFSTLGKIIWWIFSSATTAVKWFINALGGLKSALEIIGYILALVIGPFMLRQAILMTAQFIEMAIASWAIWLPWAAIGLAVAAVAIAIQDLVYWIQGKKSLIGTWVGPFEDFKKAIEDLPIIKLMTALRDFFTGDFAGALKNFTTALEDPKKLMNEILELALVGIPLAFVGWNVLKFTGIIDALGAVVKALIGVKTAAVEAEAATTAVGGGGKGKTPGAKGGGGGLLGLLSRFWWALPLLTSGDTPQVELSPDQKAEQERKAKERQQQANQKFGYTGEFWHDIGQGLSNIWSWAGFKGDNSSGPAPPGDQPPREPGSGRAGGPAFGLTDMATLMQGLTYGTMPWDVGAMAKLPVEPNITQTLTQNNTISVTTPDEAALAALIQERVTQGGNAILEQASRQLQYATPRIEAPTQ